MGQQFQALTEKHIKFIQQQKMFFVGTATDTSKINISPKGMDSFRIINEQTIAWLNVTGSGNETAAHVQSHPRMTIMFTAFEGKPMIMRLYGQAKMTRHGEPGWNELVELFPSLPGARQIFTMTIDMVQTSCGTAVPFFDYQGDREQLNQWAEKKGTDGIRTYWQERNHTSLDGIEIKNSTQTS